MAAGAVRAGHGRGAAGRVGHDATVHRLGADHRKRPDGSAPRRPPHAAAVEHAHAALAGGIEQAGVERRSVEVPAGAQRVEHEVGVVEPVPAHALPFPYDGRWRAG